MNSTKDIFEAEFKNLYALEKQEAEVLPKVQEAASNKKLKKHIQKLEIYNEKQFSRIQELLKENSINPGNVVDSVAQEIFKNLSEISGKELPTDVNDMGLLTSLNRLHTYKSACYQNSVRLAKVLKMKGIAKKLKKSQRFHQNHTGKLKKVYQGLI